MSSASERERERQRERERERWQQLPRVCVTYTRFFFLVGPRATAGERHCVSVSVNVSSDSDSTASATAQGRACEREAEAEAATETETETEAGPSTVGLRPRPRPRPATTVTGRLSIVSPREASVGSTTHALCHASRTHSRSSSQCGLTSNQTRVLRESTT